jgi:two-component system response regulator RegA
MNLTELNFLLVDDDAIFAATLTRSLTRRGFSVVHASDANGALRSARELAFQAITVDLHLTEDSGLKLIEPLRALQPHARMLVLTGFASIATAVAAVKLGANDYLSKPANTDSILCALGFHDPLRPASGQSGQKALFPDLEQTPLSVARLEWEHIQRVLTQCNGNISEAARQLNMHRRTLQRKLSKHPVKR